MIHISINAAFRGPRLEKVLRKAAKLALAHNHMDQNDLSVVITGDKRIRELNMQFRGLDEATDVLSFPSDSSVKDESRYLGDIVISLPRARVQARAAGHPLGDELQLLVVHGILHLLGHDHSEKGAKARMWAMQDEILRILGVKMDVDRAVAAQSGSQ